MIKGLAITPPALGRISIGKVVERNGKRLPEKADDFTITTQVQTRDGWLAHPVDEKLRKVQGGKIRSIPVRLVFDDPELNLRADYSLFDRNTGRPLCVGNGESCRRSTIEGLKTLPCPGPQGCELGQQQGCKPYARLNVLIGDEDQVDPCGSFVFRTTGYNSIRTLAARLTYFHAISGGKLSCLALELRLRGKSTRQSHGSPVYYVDLTLETGVSVEEALTKARQLAASRAEAGFDQEALDEAARKGLSNGAFEDTDDDAHDVVEEFFPEGDPASTGGMPNSDKSGNTKTFKVLSERLADKAQQLQGDAS